jgi:hypothetical protein
MTLRALTITLLVALGVSCSDTNIIIPTSPSAVVTSPTNPGNPNNPVVQTHKIEFRVTGNALGARVRYSNSNDGLAQVTTVLPFVFNMTTSQQSLFLSIEATPTSYSVLTTFPFMSAQIFVDGLLFRESSSSDFFLQTITASGTWRQ